MATVEVKNLEGKKVRDFEIADEIFGGKPNQSLLWEAVKQYLASQRSGTHSTKSRGEVRGGGKKPWRQKGTGRARVGSIRSSLWRHGSIAHGPKPRDYSYDLPKGMLRGALRAAIATKFQEQKLTIVDQFEFAEAKTKTFVSVMEKLGLVKGILIVDTQAGKNLSLSSRNVEGCDLVRGHELHPYHIMSHHQLLISEPALARLQESLR
jgi:large subunit ribosomal protein L4